MMHRVSHRDDFLGDDRTTVTIELPADRAHV
jgi:hypothetical protein